MHYFTLSTHPWSQIEACSPQRCYFSWDASVCCAQTGWSNLVGQFASTAGAGYLTALHIGQMWALGNGHVLSQFENFLAYARRPWSLQPRSNLQENADIVGAFGSTAY